LIAVRPLDEPGRDIDDAGVPPRPKDILTDPATEGSEETAVSGRLLVMTDGRGLDPLRLAEAAAQATLVLGLTTLPAAWHAFDGPLAAVLTGMLAALTLGIYALHAVTFDYLRLTGHRSRRSFPYTQRED
jgi:hypothetical protein